MSHPFRAGRRSLRSAAPAAIVLALAAALAAVPALGSEKSELGTVDFPNSGSEAAQEAFQRGVAALHSFWYEEAAEAFRNAQEIDPDFALAYWGEAISHNHPLWSEQDISAAREVLERFGATRAERRKKTPTERERMYLETVEVLYGAGDKFERDEKYHQALRRLAEAHPEDDEAQAFYALSYLGLVRRGEPGFHRQMKAGAIVSRLFRDKPNHPGAAHYVIHSFDDPEHAPLALEAANRYAEIAPEAHHAQHMPSHIFVQHGMWDRVSKSNEVAYRASAKWVADKNLSITKRDYHSLEWKAYADLQRGVYGPVLGAIEVVEEAAEETDSMRLRRIAASMVARHAIDTGRFDAISLPEGETDTSRYNSTANLLLAAGMKAAAAQDAAGADEAANRLRALAESREEAGESYQADSVRIMQHEVEALAASVRGETKSALKHAAMATEIEEGQDPPSGPTYPIKPSHELQGELLLAAGKAEKARAAFETSLSRTPNRTASLLGLARASAALGDDAGARRAYATLETFLTDADGDVPFLDEVRRNAASTTDQQ